MRTDRGNVLASGLRLGPVFSWALPSFFPPSSRFRRTGNGKSYPVTAAQLPPNFTEFLRTGGYRLNSQRTEPRVEQRAARRGKENLARKISPGGMGVGQTSRLSEWGGRLACPLAWTAETGCPPPTGGTPVPLHPARAQRRYFGSLFTKRTITLSPDHTGASSQNSNFPQYSFHSLRRSVQIAAPFSFKKTPRLLFRSTPGGL